jgi:hypothetical protein
MPKELILISGKELKDLVTQGNQSFLYMNGYKYFFSSVDLEKLEDNKVYQLDQKYGLLFIKTLYGKNVLVKKGISVRSKKGQ